MNHNDPANSRLAAVPYRFFFERFDVYHLALEVALELQEANFPRGLSSLRDQGVRAAQSIVLNIAEGAGRTGKARTNHYRIALGSAGEVFAVLQLAAIDNRDELLHKTRRIGNMLQKLAR